MSKCTVFNVAAQFGFQALGEKLGQLLHMEHRQYWQEEIARRKNIVIIRYGELCKVDFSVFGNLNKAELATWIFKYLAQSFPNGFRTEPQQTAQSVQISILIASRSFVLLKQPFAGILPSTRLSLRSKLRIQRFANKKGSRPNACGAFFWLSMTEC